MKKRSTLFLKLTFLVVALFTTKISFTQTVYDIIQGSPNHTTLKAAIDVAGLSADLKDANAELTVFAPTNAAFTAALTSLGITASDLLASADLKNILLYHVLGAEVLSSSLSNGQIAQPLNTTNTVKVTLDGSKVFINQAEVTAADLNATNGVVHVLDAILLPSETVADLAIGSAAHTTLVAAVIEAKLLPALTDPFSELTVFAPTNAAFTAALTNLGITAADLLASADLQDILLYHVLGAEVLSTNLSNGQIAQPLNTANTVKVTLDGNKVYINQAEVSTADLTADNGVVHVLDAILLPIETVADLGITSAAHTTLVAAVIEARLLPALTDPFSELTVFAPTDAAFTAALTSLGITAADLLASADLKDILLYHVLGAEVLSTNLSNGQIAQPLNAANTVKVTIDGSKVFINQAEVTGADLTTDNGVVHVLNAILLPIETIADIAIGSAAHTTLVAAVIEARLLPALTDPFSELTVFAPTDAAFTAALTNLGITAADLLASAELQDILLYHVLGAEVMSTNLSNGQIAQPLNATNTVKVTIDGSKVFINQAEVSAADLTADNGVVHVLNSVLLPSETVADIAIGSAAHTTLVAAVIEAKLLPALTNPFSELTVFAPTDAAFSSLATTLGVAVADILKLPNLKDILLNHVVDSALLSKDLKTGTVKAINGVNLTIDLTSGVMVNKSKVTTADLVSDNGVVHVIDAVITGPLNSMEKVMAANLSMYPNPTTDFINVSNKNNAGYAVINVNGAVVANGVVSNSNIDVTSLSKGVYTLRIMDGETLYVGRFIKK